jgi:hypothetical protein
MELVHLAEKDDEDPFLGPGRDQLRPTTQEVNPDVVIELPLGIANELGIQNGPGEPELPIIVIPKDAIDDCPESCLHEDGTNTRTERHY